MMDKELDDLFKKSFADHRMPVPDDMWQRVNPQKEKKRRTIFWWWTGLGVAALFILVGTGIWFYHASADTNAVITNSSSASQKNKNNIASVNAKPEQKKQLPALPSEDNRIKLSASSVSVTSSKPVKQKAETGKAFSFTGNKKAKENNSSAFIFNHNTWQANKDSLRAIRMSQSYKKTIEKTTNRNDNSVNKAYSNNIANSAAALPETAKADTLQNKDSSQIAADNTIKKIAKNDSSVAAVLTKKIHKQKATTIELMIAGYANDRNVYNAEKNITPSFVALGADNPKVKAKLYSTSINMRIEKPVTKHISLKTGLQFMQTRQRITYNQESVNQFTIINSLSVGRDTIQSARILSEQPVVKSVYNNINIPLLISYHTNGTKMNVGASAGVLLNVISWYSGKVPDTDYKQTLAAKSVFRQNTGASLYMSLSATKYWGNWQLFAEPNIQYTLSSITKIPASFKQKITGYGIGIGIKKTIGK